MFLAPWNVQRIFLLREKLVWSIERCGIVSHRHRLSRFCHWQRTIELRTRLDFATDQGCNFGCNHRSILVPRQLGVWNVLGRSTSQMQRYEGGTANRTLEKNHQISCRVWKTWNLDLRARMYQWITTSNQWCWGPVLRDRFFISMLWHNCLLVFTC